MVDSWSEPCLRKCRRRGPKLKNLGTELRPADWSLFVIVSVLIGSLLLAIVVVRGRHSSIGDRFGESTDTVMATTGAWRRSEIHPKAVIVKRHLALTPEVLSMMGGRPVTLRMNVPSRQKSFRASTAACVVGWIAWLMIVAALLAVILCKALP